MTASRTKREFAALLRGAASVRFLDPQFGLHTIRTPPVSTAPVARECLFTPPWVRKKQAEE